MNGARVLVEERALSLSAPVGNAQRRWTRRRSALVALLDDAGRAGYGEATPLEDFADDGFDAARADLAHGSPHALERALDAATPRAALEHWGSLQSPSARFALHSALLSLRARRAGHSLEDELALLIHTPGISTTPPSHSLPPALLLDLEAPLDTELTRVRTLGNTFKLKLGRDPQRELTRFQALVPRLFAHEHLRLDANGAFHSPDDVLPFIVPSVEFVEEPAPLREPRAFGFPLALDETLFRTPDLARRWLSAGHVAVVVLKPMALGLLETLEWAAFARRHGADVVISHCFDGAVALAHYHALAQVVGSRSLAMGLGAHPGLALWKDIAP